MSLLDTCMFDGALLTREGKCPSCAPSLAPLVTRPATTLERWSALGPRLAAHVARKPDMDSREGPQRWAQLLFDWTCEAMLLAYGRDRVREKIKDACDAFLMGK